MSESQSSPSPRRWRVGAVAGVAVVLAILVFLFARPRRDSGAIPYFTIPMGAVHKPLPYRIVSFHRGRADKNLIQLAAQLGFNGVQFQIEGSNADGIKDFAARDAKEHLIDFCHSLGMQVTVWVHELSDLPAFRTPDYLGPVSLDNQKIWDALDQRYEWILGTAIPKVDGLVLTTVETQVNATSTPIMLKIVNLIDQKCRQHGKTLVVRTFVWRPDELESVMEAVKQMPGDIAVMSKAVPQDWQMRGGNAAEIGAVGDRPQIVEYDVAGEYFLRNAVANCMVDTLKRQYDYGLTKNVQGICVRVDREDDNILFEPSEVNLWTLGLLAAGATTDTEDIWSRWATYRYGDKAAPAVIAALKPTSQVVAEMLSIGPFTFGDTRYFPYASYLLSRSGFILPDNTVFDYNWQMWHWDPAFEPVHQQAMKGEADFVDAVDRQKAAALALAYDCLLKLDQARGLLPQREFDILHTRLLSNKIQLQFRAPMAMAALHIRQYVVARATRQEAAAAAALQAYNQDLDQVSAIADSLSATGAGQTVRYLGKDWQINSPLLWPLISDPSVLHKWVDAARTRPQFY